MDAEQQKLKSILTMVYDIFKDPETANSIATMYWSLFKSLQEKGFTESQAFDIILRFNINSSK